MKLITPHHKVHYTIPCPGCDNKTGFGVEHLFDRFPKLYEDYKLTETQFGDWHCRYCFFVIRGKVVYDPATQSCDVYIEHVAEKGVETENLFHLPGTDLFFTADTLGSRRYYFEESTCPTNVLQNINEVYAVTTEGHIESDPHGVFVLVDSRPRLRPVDYVDRRDHPGHHDWTEAIRQIVLGKGSFVAEDADTYVGDNDSLELSLEAMREMLDAFEVREHFENGDEAPTSGNHPTDERR